MECGEIWVKQRNDLGDGNGGQFKMVNCGNKWQEIRRNRYIHREYYRNFRFIGWLRSKFKTTDHAKQADYLSSLYFKYLQNEIRNFSFSSHNNW